MEKIRFGVFETNSSSTHCVSISKMFKTLDTIYPDEFGVIHLYGRGFGWEIEEYSDALTKANYMAIYATKYYGLEENKELFTKNLIDVIKYQTGCDEVIIHDNEDSYIDHQSVENEDYHSLMIDKESLKLFIFNPDSLLITGNDNC